MNDSTKLPGTPRSPHPVSPSFSQSPTLVMIVTAEPARVAGITSDLEQTGALVSVTPTAGEATKLLRTTTHDLVIIDKDLPRGSAFKLLERVRAAVPETSAVLLADSIEATDAVRAMRVGARDVLDPADPAIAQRISAIAQTARTSADRSRDDMRMGSLCSKLSVSRGALAGSVGKLCDDLLGAFGELSSQLDDVSMATELNSMLRQELDVESLLHTQLEFLLARIGSMNAGIFLPSPEGDYSLGAYINYDMPRDSAEVLLDDLADIVAPAFENDRRVVQMPTADARSTRLANDAPRFDGHAVLAVGCHDESPAPHTGAPPSQRTTPAGTPEAAAENETECLAVIVLFRRERVGFRDDAVRTLQIAADLFAQQLGRVIRLHHRHHPEDEWGLDAA
ncbi:MAG: response regulator [Planctomycetota bacterium]